MWIFRILAALLIPSLALVSLELALRLTDYGHETSFFVRSRAGGEDMLISNPWFGLRFFPPALARSPLPVTMRATPPDGVYRIILFGESAAMGDPKPAYGMGRVLEALLSERYPERRFEVISTAMTAINSHAIAAIADECPRYRASLWVIYMGNNEMAGPFGANTVFGARAPPVWLVRAYLKLQATRSGQLFAAASRRVNGTSASNSWEGLKMFEGHQLPPGAAGKERVHRNFKANLEHILEAAERARAHVVLSTVASNLRDCAPFGSQHVPPLNGNEAMEWDRRFRGATTALVAGHAAEALTEFEYLVRRSPNFAEAHFQLGQCRLALGDVPAARNDFAAARDLDALPLRADSTINTIVRETAQRWSNRPVSFIDAEKRLTTETHYPVPGADSFYEHVHFKFNGNYQVARALAEQVEAQLPASIRESATRDWASPERCARWLGLTDWNQTAAAEEMIQRMAEPPFTSQANHEAQVHQLNQELAALRARCTPAARSEARAGFEEALRARPKDHWLHQSYAEFLSAGGELAAATAQMELVRDLLPEHYSGYLQLGRLQARQKRFDEAQRSLEQALRLKPDLPDARLELTRVYAARGNIAEALTQLRLQERLRPGDPAPHVARARIMEQQNRHEEAADSLREAIRLRPSSWEPHYLLGMHFILQKKFAEAQEQLEAVVKLRPEYAPGHLNLGYALARQNRFSDAVEQFRRTLALDPDNTQAKQFLESVQNLADPVRN